MTSFLRKYAVVILLLLVFANQIVRVHYDGLSSWRGGGFGMYATFGPKLYDLWWTDLSTGESRRYTKDPGKATEDDHRAGLRPFLTYANQDRLRIHHRELPPELRKSTKLEVWRLSFDPRSGELTRKRVISAPAEIQ